MPFGLRAPLRENHFLTTQLLLLGKFPRNGIQLNYEPSTLYSEIAPNLYMGGTEDDDTVYLPAKRTARYDLPFEAIVTLYALAQPADWTVQEFRYGIPDGDIADIDLDRLFEAVNFGFNRWKWGDNVLIRCQAGLNRSGLVTALILMKTGLRAEIAINQIREKRGNVALCNAEFERWLLDEADSFFIEFSSRVSEMNLRDRESQIYNFKHSEKIKINGTMDSHIGEGQTDAGN